MSCALLIRNGFVVDGTGSAPYVADVAVTDGKVAEIDPNLSMSASETVDALGKLLVAPAKVNMLRRDKLINRVQD